MEFDPIIESLHKQIKSCENQLKDLRQQLAEAENLRSQQRAQATELHRHSPYSAGDVLAHDMSLGIHDDFASEITAALSHREERPKEIERRWPLDKAEYKRYGRQLIMPEIGLQGQLNLKAASILIVGVGGLGCPSAAYLCGAGIGTLGLIDGDVVEESNLHRQILHSTSRVGMTKVESAKVALGSLNPNVKIIGHPGRLNPQTSLSTFQPYDLILDCTDNPATRYLISDTCVLLRKPLVSASALRTDGQLMVLNDPPLPPGDPSGGPCYRCVFPKPPPPESVVSCGDGGILGPVVGTMGVLQALEAIKVLTRVREGNIQKADGKAQEKQAGHSLLIFSAYASPQFRTIRLRPTRKPKCAGCSAQASVTAEALTSGSMDYVQFCGAVSPVDALSASERMSASNYAKFRNSVGGHPNPNAAGGGRGMNRPSSDTHILVDVREKVQFELCNLEGSINIPFSTVTRMPAPSSPSAEKSDMEGVEPEWIAQLKTQARNEKPIFVVCRLGNDSQVAVRKMKAFGLDNGGKRWVGDIKGGLRAWRESVDEEFPEY